MVVGKLKLKFKILEGRKIREVLKALVNGKKKILIVELVEPCMKEQLSQFC